ncbi:MAG: MFS transporter [Candidatus Moraniibacteriota bacterium]
MKPRNPLYALLFTVLIDMIGVGIIIPILAPIFLGIEGALFLPDTTVAFKTIVLGILLATYPFAQFFGAPYLGTLSDIYGRKKFLLLSLAGTVFGYLLFGVGILTHSLTLLFVSRIIDGFTGGNISIALSAIADISTPENKTKNFGLIGASFGVGFIIGPWLGGQLADPRTVSWFNDATPLWVAAGLALINMLLLARNFQETLQKKKSILQSPSFSFFQGFANIKQAFLLISLRRLFLVSMFYTLGFNFFTQFFQVFLVTKFNFSHAEIGNFFGVIGLWIVIAQGALIRPLSQRFPPRSLLRIVMPLFAISTLAYLIPDRAILLFFIVPFFSSFNGFILPNLNTLISNAAHPEEQGKILGINQSLQALAMTIPPLVAGVAFTVNQNLPIILCALLVIVGWLVLLTVPKPTTTLA